jgi:hypothetical protein
MRRQTKLEAEARPIALDGPDHQRTLVKVIVTCDTRLSHGLVNLSTDQALYIHSRLTQLVALFLHGGRSGLTLGLHPDLTQRDEDPAARLGPYAADAWPIVGEEPDCQPVLDAVLIESNHPDGHGVVRLTPQQTVEIRDRLEQISLNYLHENTWGGEDARRQ